jgi:hypothetical protein
MGARPDRAALSGRRDLDRDPGRRCPTAGRPRSARAGWSSRPRARTQPPSRVTLFRTCADSSSANGANHAAAPAFASMRARSHGDTGARSGRAAGVRRPPDRRPSASCIRGKAGGDAITARIRAPDQRPGPATATTSAPAVATSPAHGHGPPPAPFPAPARHRRSRPAPTPLKARARHAAGSPSRRCRVRVIARARPRP